MSKDFLEEKKSRPLPERAGWKNINHVIHTGAGVMKI